MKVDEECAPTQSPRRLTHSSSPSTPATKTRHGTALHLLYANNTAVVPDGRAAAAAGTGGPLLPPVAGAGPLPSEVEPDAADAAADGAPAPAPAPPSGSRRFRHMGQYGDRLRHSTLPQAQQAESSNHTPQGKSGQVRYRARPESLTCTLCGTRGDRRRSPARSRRRSPPGKWRTPRQRARQTPPWWQFPSQNGARIRRDLVRATVWGCVPIALCHGQQLHQRYNELYDHDWVESGRCAV